MAIAESSDTDFNGKSTAFSYGSAPYLPLNFSTITTSLQKLHPISVTWEQDPKLLDFFNLE